MKTIRWASRVYVSAITPDGQMAGQTDAQAPEPAPCTSSNGHLLMYQVSFNSLIYFQRYAPDKLFIAKIKKGSHSANTGDRVMILASCNFIQGPLSVYQILFIFVFNTFIDVLHTSLLLQKKERIITLQLLVIKLRFLHSALPLMAVYQFIKFH